MSAKMVPVTKAINRLLPSSAVPPSLRPKFGNLYEVISRTPLASGKTRVHQTRWGTKQILDSYWTVTRAEFKDGGKHGKAWGKLTWKGKVLDQPEQRIPGALKYTWAEGPSRATTPPTSTS